MKNNKFTTVLLIILIIVCTFQGCSITNMNSNIENLNMTLNQMENNLENLEYRVEDLESVAYGNIGMQMDYYYELKEVDLASGKLLVDYIVSLEHVTSDTRILIRVGKDSYELELNNQVFTGTVVYPMNKDAYETVMYRYEVIGKKVMKP